MSGCQLGKPAETGETPPPQQVKTTAAPAAKDRTVSKQTEAARRIPEPERIYPDPDALMGSPAADVARTIGEPMFIRKDHPAEIWQYRGETCTLDIFLYQDVTGEPHRVDHIETRSQPGGPATNRDCLKSILIEREGLGAVG